MKSKMVFLLVTVCMIFPTFCYSSVSRFCAVSYLTNEGWSKEFIIEVVFLSGYEINDLETGNPAHNPYMPGPDWVKLVKFFYDKQRAEKSVYGLTSDFVCIWFNQEEVAILELPSSGFLRDNDFSSMDFQNYFTYRSSVDASQVNSQHRRKWRIRAKETFPPFGFIDKR
jgi:hypothetical protein